MSPPAALVAALLAFASNVSGLPVPPDHTPHITITAQAPDGRWLGFTQPEAGVTYIPSADIYIHADWVPDVDGYCLLAHELTHYLQALNPDRDPGTAVGRERQAYRVHVACFEHYGDRRGAAWARRMVQHPHLARQLG